MEQLQKSMVLIDSFDKAHKNINITQKLQTCEVEAKEKDEEMEQLQKSMGEKMEQLQKSMVLIDSFDKAHKNINITQKLQTCEVEGKEKDEEIHKLQKENDE
eukprot:450004_1